MEPDDIPLPTDADAPGGFAPAPELTDDDDDELLDRLPKVTPSTAAKAAAAAEVPAGDEEERQRLEGLFVRYERDWFDKPPPPPRFLLRLTPAQDGSALGGDDIPWMPRGAVCLLTAPGGTGKSTLLAAVALSVAVGRDLITGLRPEELAKGQRVLFVLGEEDKAKVRRMFYTAGKVLGLKDAEKDRAARHLFTLAGSGEILRLYDEVERRDTYTGSSINRLTTEPTLFAEVLRERLTKREDREPPWALVVMDPGSRFSGARDENDNAAATRFIQALEVLRSVPDEPTILLAHHTGKGQSAAGQDSARGASALVDGARWHATLQREQFKNADEKAPHAIRVEVSKSNDTPTAPRMPTLWLRMKPAPDGHGVTVTRETATEAKERLEYALQREAAANEAEGKRAEGKRAAKAKAKADTEEAKKAEEARKRAVVGGPD